MSTLGNRLKVAREAAQLTQVALGKLIHVTSQSISQWEAGTKSPSRNNLLAVARATSAPLQWLLFGGPLPERDGNGNFVSTSERGQSVPQLSIGDAVDRKSPSANARRITAVFPCSDDAYYFLLPDASNSPAYPEGTAWVIDPNRNPTAGAMVLAAVGDERRPIFGRLRYETSAKGHVTLISPLNTDWPGTRSDLETIDIIGVMTESIHRG